METAVLTDAERLAIFNSAKEYLDKMMRRTPEELAEDRRRILATSRPARPLPPGKTLEDVIVGCLPDEKSDEEIRAALEELS